MIRTRPHEHDPIMTPAEALEYLKIGRTQFYELLRDGRIRYVRQASKRYFRRSFLDEYLDSLPVVEGPREREV